MKEIWKDIEGFEGLYQVSNLGKIRSLDKWVNNKYGTKTFKKGRVLKNSLIKSTGYYRVSLSKDNSFISKSVHQIVAKAFLKNPNNYTQINHKDENKSNNSADNLEWCDCNYNNNYGQHSINISKARRKNKKGFKKVIQYDKNLNIINTFESTRQASRELKMNQSAISRCCRGVQKYYSECIWRYG